MASRGAAHSMGRTSTSGLRRVHRRRRDTPDSCGRNPPPNGSFQASPHRRGDGMYAAPVEAVATAATTRVTRREFRGRRDSERRPFPRQKAGGGEAPDGAVMATRQCSVHTHIRGHEGTPQAHPMAWSLQRTKPVSLADKERQATSK